MLGDTKSKPLLSAAVEMKMHLSDALIRIFYRAEDVDRGQRQRPVHRGRLDHQPDMRDPYVRRFEGLVASYLLELQRQSE